MVGQILYNTDIKEIKLLRRGKVRDIYELDPNHLLIVSTDRISCFDVVLPTGIPCKGKVLNQMSTLWFNFTKVIIPNHFVTGDLSSYPKIAKYAKVLQGRAMVVKKARALPLECIVRGYLTGSGWKEYQESGTVCGEKLPEGLKECDRLPEPIFTPSTKADSGHDQNIPFSSAQGLLGNTLVQKMKEISIQLYKGARIYSFIRGIIIADTKFEFGLINNQLVLIDEILTPDSSRFWPKDQYEPGKSQPSFDKQYVRDYLESTGWAKKPPAPQLPPEVILKTQEKYRQAARYLTGKDIED